MLTLKDAEFKALAEPGFGHRAHLSFPNGYGASIVCGGPLVHGDLKRPFEVAVLRNGEITYDTPITDDVVG